ncbi:Transcriptional regulatory protein TdiR [Novipirellula aureliae]|uniref:Transcriptional regulatory protein TdiR n=1 Tax=Novipirellula aureliae TaxID=2527966 RepID=A0A5C6DXU2_9BACT|nr:LuxR C-terminal-related transcriptional regulator [Novipirellula aureliae]TWU41225.1 Transcriptional regulatory protein TdiR [Novipirellula aureliae]
MLQPAVFLVEKDPTLRRSLVRMLKCGGYTVEAFAAPSKFLAEFDAARPGCLVLAHCFSDMSGLEFYKRLVEKGCRLPYLITIAADCELSVAIDAMKNGALDVMEHPLDRDAFLDQVWQAIGLDEERRRQQFDDETFQDRLSKLSRREREVMDLVIAGRLTKQIARQLDISPKTVEAHRSHIIKKMQVKSLVDLVRVVTEHRPVIRREGRHKR